MWRHSSAKPIPNWAVLGLSLTMRLRLSIRCDLIQWRLLESRGRSQCNRIDDLCSRGRETNVGPTRRFRRCDCERFVGSGKVWIAGEYIDYAASKGAIETFTIGLATEVAGERIRVTANFLSFVEIAMPG